MASGTRKSSAVEVGAFLSHLAVERRVSASTQTQARSALLFLYGRVLEVQLPWLDDVAIARPQKKLPVVLTSSEGLCWRITSSLPLADLDVDPKRFHALANQANDLDVTLPLEVPQAEGEAVEPPAAQTVDVERLADRRRADAGLARKLKECCLEG